MKTLRFYGIVEGFFSYPLPFWSQTDRMNTLRFICENRLNINTYFYCPKDDPYVLKRWSKLYPIPKILNLQKTISFCKKNNLRFVYGFNPPLSVDMNFQKKEKWLKRVIYRLNQLRSVGCYNFCLLFDNIPLAYELINNPSAQTGETIGKLLVRLMNTLYKMLKNKIEELWLCAPDYCFRKETLFTKQIQNLNPEIPLIWTGNDVFVRNITKKDLLRIKEILGAKKKIIWWSNYPVNDCEQNVGTFNLGGFKGPSEKVLQKLYGIMVNPMRECYANLPFYLTFSDYIYSPKNYARNRAWQKALRQLIGDHFKSYYLIFKEFSARNLVDSQPNFLYRKFCQTMTNSKMNTLVKQIYRKLSVIKKKPPTTLWGKLFVSSVASIIEDGQSFACLVEKILSREKITKEKLNRYDRFPTTLTVPRYFPEIYKIIRARFSLLPNNLQKGDKSKSFLRLNYEFKNRYKGRKKLCVTKTESLKIIKAIKNIVGREREAFVQLLNNQEISLVQKIKILSLRQNINRFTTNG